MDTQAQLFRLIGDFLVTPTEGTWERPDYLGEDALATCIDADWEGEIDSETVRENLAAYLELLVTEGV